MIRNRRVRRSTAIALLASGALLMWLAPPASAAGITLLALGIVLEAIGIAVEHRDKL